MIQAFSRTLVYSETLIMELLLLLNARILAICIQIILESLKVYSVFKEYTVFFKYVLNYKRIPRVLWCSIIRFISYELDKSPVMLL